MIILAHRVWRIGAQTLWRDEHGQCWISIHNRTYDSRQPVAEDRVFQWLEVFHERTRRS